MGGRLVKTNLPATHHQPLSKRFFGYYRARRIAEKRQCGACFIFEPHIGVVQHCLPQTYYGIPATVGYIVVAVFCGEVEDIERGAE